MTEQKKLIVASALFVVALALIGWYLFFGRADAVAPVSEPTKVLTEEELAAPPPNQRTLPERRGRR